MIRRLFCGLRKTAKTINLVSAATHPGGKMDTTKKPVILLIAEAVTLAHFARIITLSKALDKTVYEVVVASDPRFLNLEAPLDCAFHPLKSIPSAEFSNALDHGKPLYSLETLTSYVEDDLELIKRVKPDLIVGDFRLSLAVSAPLAGVPYAAVVNSYWSPYAILLSPDPIPDWSMTRILGVSLAQKLFNLVRPMGAILHSRPLNKLRKRHHLPSLGNNLRNVYAWGDYTLYADVPELVPMRPLPANHRHLGALLWSTKSELPSWWSKLPEDKPIVMVNLGSSGRAELLPMALASLAELPITVIAATAGKIDLAQVPSNVFVAPYLPMDIASQRADLLICNGGSLSTYQALSMGVPVLGFCSNMDQLLNMKAIEGLGAGLTLRASTVTPAQLKENVARLLETPTYGQAAAKAGQRFKLVNAAHNFRKFVAEVLDPKDIHAKKSCRDRQVST